MVRFYGMMFFHEATHSLELNCCSNGCVYCYAKQKRMRCEKIKYNSDLKYMAEKKYSACMCNNTDPLIKLNIGAAETYINELNDLGVPVSIQTKGHHENIPEWLLKSKSDFYITITHWDNNVLKRIEPNAPSYEHRVELCRAVIDSGHGLEVGINPINYEWLSEGDFVKILEDLSAVGCKCFFTAGLHAGKNFLPKQIKNNMRNKVYVEYLIGKYMDDFNVYRTGAPFYSNNYKRSINCNTPFTFSEFVNNAITSNKYPTADDFYRAFVEKRPYSGDIYYIGFFIANSYIHYLTDAKQINQISNDKEFCDYIFNHSKLSPLNNHVFDTDNKRIKSKEEVKQLIAGFWKAWK
jgi:DNA repair photolyase